MTNAECRMPNAECRMPNGEFPRLAGQRDGGPDERGHHLQDEPIQ
jgi:hypothetical protein